MYRAWLYAYDRDRPTSTVYSPQPQRETRDTKCETRITQRFLFARGIAVDEFKALPLFVVLDIQGESHVWMACEGMKNDWFIFMM